MGHGLAAEFVIRFVHNNQDAGLQELRNALQRQRSTGRVVGRCQEYDLGTLITRRQDLLRDYLVVLVPGRFDNLAPTYLGAKTVHAKGGYAIYYLIAGADNCP